MPSFVSAAVHGTGVTRKIEALRSAVADLRPFWREVFAPRYFAQVQDVFASQGRRRNRTGQYVAGGAWQPLSPRYAAWKRKHYPGRGILERSGALRGSLRWGGSGLGPGGVFEAYPDHAIAGTSIPHGKVHQKGRQNMPARPFLDAPDTSLFGPLLKAWVLLRSAGSRR